MRHSRPQAGTTHLIVAGCSLCCCSVGRRYNVTPVGNTWIVKMHWGPTACRTSTLALDLKMVTLSERIFGRSNLIATSAPPRLNPAASRALLDPYIEQCTCVGCPRLSLDVRFWPPGRSPGGPAPMMAGSRSNRTATCTPDLASTVSYASASRICRPIELQCPWTARMIHVRSPL